MGLCTLGTARRLRWLELRKHEENRTEGGERVREMMVRESQVRDDGGSDPLVAVPKVRGCKTVNMF